MSCCSSSGRRATGLPTGVRSGRDRRAPRGGGHSGQSANSGEGDDDDDL